MREYLEYIKPLFPSSNYTLDVNFLIVDLLFKSLLLRFI